MYTPSDAGCQANKFLESYRVNSAAISTDKAYPLPRGSQQYDHRIGSTYIVAANFYMYALFPPSNVLLSFHTPSLIVQRGY